MVEGNVLQIETEEIPLFRGGTVVTSLASSFGYSLKETRLTALLGYLISLIPEPFIELFQFKGTIIEIKLEMRHLKNRSDILIKTTHGTGIVEAKLDSTDPFEQCNKYPANWKILLTQYIPTEKQKCLKNVKYLNWNDISRILNGLKSNTDHRVKFLSSDILCYLKEHRMILKKDSIEVYLREINEKDTLKLFLHGKLYGCDFKPKSRLSEALYFAPYFGKYISYIQPGIATGISYIAKIETVEIVETKSDLENIIISKRKKHWLNTNKHLIEPILNQWDWTNKRRYFFFLGEPRLVFNPSIKKDNLMKEKGRLNKHFLSFDELFQAWSGNKLYL